MKKLEEAIKCYNRAIEIDPNFYQAYYNKGLALYDLNKGEEAIENLIKSVQLSPNDEDGYRSIVAICSHKGKEGL